jgi:hypothetical protein
MTSTLSLEDAESYLSSTAAQHTHTLTALAAMRERFTGVLHEKDEACQALTKKAFKYSKSLQTVKLVSAQMIQQREEQIMALLQQVEQLKGPCAGTSS